MNKAFAWVLALVMLPVLASESIQLRADPEALSRLAAVDQNAAQLALNYGRTSSPIVVQELTGSVTMRTYSRRCPQGC